MRPRLLSFTLACLPVPIVGAAKAVLMVMACRANNDTGRCWSSVPDLVLGSGWRRTAVLDAIQELEGLGLIAVVRRPGRLSTYVLRRAAIEAMCPARNPDDDMGGDDDGDAADAAQDQSATRTSPPGGPVRHTDRGSPPGGPDQSAGRTRTLQNSPELEKTPQPPQAGAAVVDGFQQFWDAYPRREARGLAERAWRRLNPTSAAAANILAALALQRQSAAWQREGGRFVPMPAKWLRGRRWADGVQSGQSRVAPPDGWQDDPAQVKAVGASIGRPFSLAGLGNGWTDDQRIAHYRAYRADVLADVASRQAGPERLHCLRCDREGHNSEDCKVELPREARA